MPDQVQQENRFKAGLIAGLRSSIGTRTSSMDFDLIVDEMFDKNRQKATAAGSPYALGFKIGRREGINVIRRRKVERKAQAELKYTLEQAYRERDVSIVEIQKTIISAALRLEFRKSIYAICKGLTNLTFNEIALLVDHVSEEPVSLSAHRHRWRKIRPEFYEAVREEIDL